MIPVADAILTVLKIAGVVGEAMPYVNVILRITEKGENISQEELDALLADVNKTSEQIQNVKDE